jgi:hypothetical protein
MADVYAAPYSGMTDVTQIIVAATQAALIARVNLVKALIPDPTDTTPESAAHPDFDDIPPHTAAKLRAELDALADAIDSAPTS